MKLDKVRELYLSFFEEKEHLRMPSASLVPYKDKSLFLINSGMAPLKPFFLGVETPPKDRITTCQKCIRTGDIENVGYTARHGTFFEMLGNFSFNDYFKEEAILFGYEFCTEVLKLDKDKLYYSVYEEDDEAFNIWHEKVGIPKERIYHLGKEDNFWEVGLGPCGPCSEIYYDRGEAFGCGNDTCVPGCDCDRFVEFWNLVFTQYNKEEDGSYSKLDRVNIDTGMGLERMAAIMQNVPGIFDIDTMVRIRNRVSRLAGIEYGADQKSDVSIRVITDHVRAITFMAGDKIIPSGTERGYIMRRLARRAVRHGKLLNISGEFLGIVSEEVIEAYKNAYPELSAERSRILEILAREETGFNKTLNQGLELIAKIAEDTKKSNTTVIPGELAFKMYDTYGFPLELMEEILREQRLTIDMESYEQHMEQQRERARAAREETGFLENTELYSQLPKDSTVFIGYNTGFKLEEKGKIYAIITDSHRESVAHAGEDVSILTNITPFYPEGGGQKGDGGIIKTDTGTVEIFDCKHALGEHIFHFGKVTEGYIEENQEALLQVDIAARGKTIRNHTGTHLLHAALREVLGTHVEQAGSHKDSAKLRLDFRADPVDHKDLEKIETLVNQKIMENLPVEITTMPLDEAKAKGALALFDEKYGDTVRVVNIPPFSMELCGGIHVRNTGEIGLFKILSESSVSQGIRRIEALTGENALAFVNDRENILRDLKALLKDKNVLKKTQLLLEQNKTLQQEIESLNQKLNAGVLDEYLDKAEIINGRNTIIARLDKEPKALQAMGDEIKNKLKSCIIVLMGKSNDKVTVLVMATDDIVKSGFKAGDMAKSIAPLVGGSGGGRPNMAMAGGPDVKAIDDALTKTKALLLNI